jgi:hypothetical protein
MFGYSVAVSDNTVAVSAPQLADKTIHLGTSKSSSLRTAAGAVFTFKRLSDALDYRFFETLLPTNVRMGDRFGHSVAIDGNVLLVSSLEEFDGDAYTPEKNILLVRSFASYNQMHLGGHFVLSWLSSNASVLVPQAFSTRPIAHNISAAKLKTILQDDLHTGPLRVWRSEMDAYDGGYMWKITFVSRDMDVPLFESDIRLLTGTNASVEVSYINKMPHRIRGLTHLFNRPDSASKFVEELFLSPFKDQRNDLCGTAVAVSGKYALVGCPNRDQRYHNQNSGAAFVFHLGLLGMTLHGPSNTGNVSEGAVASVRIDHDENHIDSISEDILFYFQTLDRNGNEYFQSFYRYLFGIDKNDLRYPNSVIDHSSTVGNAVARSQNYGSIHRESQWADGQFDYRGIGDYVHVMQPHTFLIESESDYNDVVTTADTILETPNEHFVVGVHTPGVFPSVLGRFRAPIEIRDDREGVKNAFGDGYYDGITRYSKIYDNQHSSALSLASATKDTGIGSTVAVNDEIGVMFAGAPLQLDGKGKVLQYNKENEMWMQTVTISSPTPLLQGNSPSGSSRFGSSVAVNKVYDRNVSLLAIGEPGINRVHVYSSENSTVGRSYVHEASFAVIAEDEYGSAYR